MRKILITLMLTLAIMANGQSLSITGPSTALVGYGNDYSVAVTGTDKDNYEYFAWDVNSATFDYDYQVTGFAQLEITPNEEGTATLWCTLVDFDAVYPTISASLQIEAKEYVPPSYIPPPTISGPSTAYEGSTRSYSMPSGKQAYEWILPFYGVTHVQQYNNIKVVYFEVVPGSGQQRTIQGRYKENGYWSEYGS
jgi:hypothetical protein